MNAPSGRRGAETRPWGAAWRRWRWLLVVGALSSLWVVWQPTPTERTLRFSLGPGAQLDELEFACEGEDDTRSGARHRFSDEAPELVVHRAAFVGNEVRCEINLRRDGARRSFTRRMPLVSDEVTVLLHDELQKLRTR